MSTRDNRLETAWKLVDASVTVADAVIDPPPVLNIKTAPGVTYDGIDGLKAPDDCLYIGRFMPGLAASPLANPFKVKADTEAERAAAVVKWQHWYLDQHPGPFLETLRGRKLLCWCHPKLCHGNPLAWLVTQQKAHGQPCPQCGEPVWSVLAYQRVFGLYETWHCNRCKIRGMKQRELWQIPVGTNSLQRENLLNL